MLRPVFIILACCAIGCGPIASSSDQPHVLRLAVTTSTRDSGLLEVILPDFESEHDARVDVVAVGTGAAIKLGESGDVDAILCHARKQELEFIQAGHGTRREDVMHNSFVLLGPSSDPAGIRGTTATEGLTLIRNSKQPFVSRGDQSGTHQRELQIWNQACSGLEQWDGYLETGQGMGNSLIVADQKQAYMLCDYGTYLKFNSKIELVPLIDTGRELENPYGVLTVNPDKNEQIQASLAEAFVDYLIAPETQRVIGEYRVEGAVLFHPSQAIDVN